MPVHRGKLRTYAWASNAAINRWRESARWLLSQWEIGLGLDGRWVLLAS